MNVLKSLLYQCVSLPEDQVFDKLMEKIDDYSLNLNLEKNGTMKSIKDNKNKWKGDIFELICVNMIRNNSFKDINCKNVWLFKELPTDLREKFSFTERDMGIDIIVETVNDHYLAVQCKYRKTPNKSKVTLSNGKTIYKKWQVTWSELSTFYSLCQRTGPEGNWYKHVVITTAESVGREGRKNYKDLSICVGTFRTLSKDEWFKLLGDKGNTLNEEKKSEKFIIDMSKLNLNNKVDINLVRQKRLLALEKK